MGTSLVVQWIRIHLANAGDSGLIPALGRFHIQWGNETHAPRAYALHLEKPPQ